MPLELGWATPEGPTSLARARLPFMLTPAPTKDAKKAKEIDNVFALDRVLFFVPYITAIPRSFAFRGAFTPEESQVGQGVDEFLIGHGGIGKHASAGMAVQDCTRALLVGAQAQLIRISQIDRWGIELSDKRCGFSCKFRSLVLVPVDAMAVVAHAFSVEDRSTTLSIACHFCALG